MVGIKQGVAAVRDFDPANDRLGTSAVVIQLTPVTFAPGRLKLATIPPKTGSPPLMNTMGMVLVAPLAACAGAFPPAVTITSTCCPTRSAARAGRRFSAVG
jgi:hypothetical protein